MAFGLFVLSIVGRVLDGLTIFGIGKHLSWICALPAFMRYASRAHVHDGLMGPHANVKSYVHMRRCAHLLHDRSCVPCAV